MIDENFFLILGTIFLALTLTNKKEKFTQKAGGLLNVYDEELQAKMGRRGRKLAEKAHNWDKCEERIESLYRYVKLNAN